MTSLGPLFWFAAVQFGVYALGWAACSLWVTEERPAAAYCALFSLLVAVGFALVSYRTGPTGWLTHAGSNIVLVAGFSALRRASERFMRLPSSPTETLIVLVVSSGAIALLGLSSELAWLRTIVCFAVVAFLVTRTALAALAPIRAEFGDRFALLAMVPAGGLVVGIAVRIAQQLADRNVPLEIHGDSSSNFGLLVVYIVLTGIFTFVVMGMLLRRVLKGVRELSLQDSLTGLPNRRAYDARMAQEWNRFRRSGAPYNLLAIDLDHFKQINDTYGHAVGDHVLVQVAKALQSGARKNDLVVRLGGEEFAVLLTDQSSERARDAAERIRRLIASTSFDTPGLTVTASIGLATADAADVDAARVLERADSALYRAKSEGRNCVCVA